MIYARQNEEKKHKMHLAVYEHVRNLLKTLSFPNNLHSQQKIVFEEIIHKLIDWAFRKVF